MALYCYYAPSELPKTRWKKVRITHTRKFDVYQCRWKFQLVVRVVLTLIPQCPTSERTILQNTISCHLPLTGWLVFIEPSSLLLVTPPLPYCLSLYLVASHVSTETLVSRPLLVFSLITFFCSRTISRFYMST